MASRPPITFYPNQLVENWLAQLPKMQRSQAINNAIMLQIGAEVIENNLHAEQIEEQKIAFANQVLSD